MAWHIAVPAPATARAVHLIRLAASATDQLLAAWCAVQEVAAAPVVNGSAAAAAAVEQPGEGTLSLGAALVAGDAAACHSVSLTQQ